MPAPARFTPTRVGNTSEFHFFAPFLPVHPHACGEYAKHTEQRKVKDGSPPRVWGIRNVKRHPPAQMRFTPTRVGNTCLSCSPAAATTVHPHACGEYVGVSNR